MLHVSVRFKEKDATVRYLPGKVGLAQILKRYDDTPFDVTPSGPIVSIFRTKTAKLRGWMEREKPKKSPPRAKAVPAARKPSASKPIVVFVEIVPVKGIQIASSARLSLTDPLASGLKLRQAFRTLKATGHPVATRFVAQLAQTSALKPGEMTVPVSFHIMTVDANGKQHVIAGTFDVVLHTPPSAPAANAATRTGVALIGGSLELRLGHLCSQRGCVEHLHKSLAAVPGVAGMRPHASLMNPRATVFLRADQA
ncbi:MAG: hypothetical protein IID45_08410, partial [Planctomycetes bacterium]|nr:hypothetical protein [Planctomycetota bacterium]